MVARQGSAHLLTSVCVSMCRHSPKVVKAASQVLSSMWQYRDLRSLYKKVRSGPAPKTQQPCVKMERVDPDPHHHRHYLTVLS